MAWEIIKELLLLILNVYLVVFVLAILCFLTAYFLYCKYLDNKSSEE
jgi:hypothetical protein